MTRAILTRLALVTGASLMLAAVATAQTPVQPQPRDPNMPGAQNILPEKVPAKPGETTGSTQSLSDKLQASDGVITPPATGAGPVIRPTDPGTTPVIPPAGEPGSARPNVEPK